VAPVAGWIPSHIDHCFPLCLAEDEVFKQASFGSRKSVSMGLSVFKIDEFEIGETLL